MTKTIGFNGKRYAQTGYVGRSRNVIALDDSNITSSNLLELYNLVSANLGRGRVKRFADLNSARRRTWAILEEYDAQGPAGAEPATKKGETPINESGSKLVNTGKDAFKVELSEKDKTSIKQEAADRKATTSTSTVERWRTPKRREPSKRCYKPRPGSKQDAAYKLLTKEGGIRVEDLCAEMSKLDKLGKNNTEWKEPGTIWGSLNYLFVAQKGYGLDFDGERIRLLIGKEEVAFSNKPKA
jgi:hypothetical protein